MQTFADLNRVGGMRVVPAALEVAAAAAGIPIAFLNGGVLLVVLVATGTALVMGRFLVIGYAPWIGHHSKVLAGKNHGQHRRLNWHQPQLRCPRSTGKRPQLS